MSDDRPGPPGSQAPGERLESWKEIAAYLGRTPRTVQRWERQERLPVHRLGHDRLASVYALRSELDEWWRLRQTALEAEPPEPAELAEAEPAPSAPPSRRLRPSALGAAVVVVLSGLALWISRSGREEVATSPELASTPVRLAVLPFRNLTGEPESEFLSDGLTEELLVELGRLHPEGLGVIARGSVMRYKGEDTALAEIARELRVDYLLEGSLRRKQDGLRVAVGLVRAGDQIQIWAQAYDRPSGDLAGLEEELARRVGREIHLKLAEGRRRPRVADEVAPEAYEAYLRGRFFLNQRSPDGFRRAKAELESALERDPSLARAWAALADTYSLMANYGVLRVAEAYPEARRAAERALELDPDLAEAHASLAFILRNHDWDFDAAEREFLRALSLNPSDVRTWAWYGLHLMALERFDEAEEALQKARALDPVSPAAQGQLANLQLLAGRGERAVAAYRAALELDPGNVVLRLDLGRALALAGEWDAALAELRPLIEETQQHPMVLAVVGSVAARAGRLEEASELEHRLERLEPGTYVNPYYKAVLATALGDRDAAFAWLEQVYEERHVGMLSFATEPEFEPLESDPRFAELKRRVGLPQ